jgi:hypothetical protein
MGRVPHDSHFVLAKTKQSSLPHSPVSTDDSKETRWRGSSGQYFGQGFPALILSRAEASGNASSQPPKILRLNVREVPIQPLLPRPRRPRCWPGACHHRGVDDRLELVYKESLRAIETQQAALESARSRAGQILAAASVVTSVLGGLVHSKSSHPHAATWVALASFALLMVLCVWVFLPRNWSFVNSATVMIDDWIGAADAPIDLMHRELALRMEQHWDKNQDPLNKMMLLLQASGILLVVSIVAWLIDLVG